MTAFVFFLSPESKESTLLVSYADNTHILVPATLLQNDDQRAQGANAFGPSLEFVLQS